MLWLRNLSIQHKLTIIIMVTSTLVLLLAGGAFFVYQVSQYRQEIADRMLSQAGIVAASNRLPVHFNDNLTAQETLSALRSQPAIVLGMVFGQGKRPIAYYLRAGENLAQQSATGKKMGEELPGLLASGEPTQIFHERYLDIVVPIVNEGETIGAVYLRSDLEELDSYLLRFGLVALGILGGAFLLASLLSINLQQFISRPLLDLVQTMEEVGRQNDFSLRARRETDDEIGTLIDRFNTMLVQLQSRDEALATHRQNLEAQVGARTRELQEVNARLNEAVEELGFARDAALAANEAKSLFLANVSHEIRTPMVGILGMSELLLRSALAKQQQEMVGTILRSGESLLALLSDILDFSRIEAGKLRLDEVPFNLRETIADAVSLLAEKGKEKGLRVALHFDPQFPEKAVGDPGRVRQIILNLVSNGIKFTEEGEVAVRARLLRADDADLHLRIEVADTGIGIEQNALEEIFESFSQADNSSARQFGGAGLGLSIVKELVQLMGGEIGVESEPDRGSTFWLTLRVKRPPATGCEGREGAAELPTAKEQARCANESSC